MNLCPLVVQTTLGKQQSISLWQKCLLYDGSIEINTHWPSIYNDLPGSVL
jgi:hypothetical protein